MKILVIPDVHGTNNWEKIKSIPNSTYNFVVFLGDYFDSWENNWPEQGENFKNICNWVREKPDTRKICFGNHDWSVTCP